MDTGQYVIRVLLSSVTSQVTELCRVCSDWESPRPSLLEQNWPLVVWLTYFFQVETRKVESFLQFWRILGYEGWSQVRSQIDPRLVWLLAPTTSLHNQSLGLNSFIPNKKIHLIFSSWVLTKIRRHKYISGNSRSASHNASGNCFLSLLTQHTRSGAHPVSPLQDRSPAYSVYCES